MLDILNFDDLREWVRSHFVQGLALTLVGVAVGWLFARWRRHRLLRRLECGDARDVVTVEQILVREQPDGHTTMRIRSCGSEALRRVLINSVAYEDFLRRAEATTPTDPIISMKDRTGSYLLYLLLPWVCGKARAGPFPHDLWVMCPVCETSILSAHQSTTVVLVRESDLRRFLDWEWCRALRVEHGSDGARVLTLWHMAREFEKQKAELGRLREGGHRTTYVETMYLLDLGLDTEEAPVRTKSVPWDRFAPTLRQLGLG
jgi:hypothetical protein